MYPVHVLGAWLEQHGGSKPFVHFSASFARSELKRQVMLAGCVDAQQYALHDMRRGHAQDLMEKVGICRKSYQRASGPHQFFLSTWIVRRLTEAPWWKLTRWNRIVMTSERPGPAASHRAGLCWLRLVSFVRRLRGPRSNWFGTAPVFFPSSRSRHPPKE